MPPASYENNPDDDIWDSDLSEDDEASLFSSAAPSAAKPKRAAQSPSPPPPAAGAAQSATTEPAAGTEPGAGGSSPASSGSSGSSGGHSSSEEILVGSGNTKQRRLRLVKADQIGWTFREQEGHGIDFAVFFVQTGMGPGDEIKVTPLQRCASHAGTYVAKGAGELVMMFDNAFSWWTDKLVKFEVTRLRLGQDAGQAGNAGVQNRSLLVQSESHRAERADILQRRAKVEQQLAAQSSSPNEGLFAQPEPEPERGTM